MPPARVVTGSASGTFGSDPTPRDMASVAGGDITMVQTPSTGRGTAGGGAAPDDSARSAAGMDADDLRASLTALSRLSTGGLGLEDLLVQVATFAVQAIPRADGAGLTMIEPERSDIVVASAPFVTDIDAIQYGLGEGPCLSAVCDAPRCGRGRWVAIRAGRGSVRGPVGWGCTACCRCRW